MVKYSISGGAYFWSGYLVFFLCDKGLGLDLWWSKLISNIVGVTVNYLLTRFWAFGKAQGKQAYEEAPLRYLLITAVNFVLDYWIVYGLKTVGITPYIGQFGSAAFFWGWNYLWYKHWVYKAKDAKARRQQRKAARQQRKAERRIARQQAKPRAKA